MRINRASYAKLPPSDTKPIDWSDDFQFEYPTREEAEEKCPIKVGDVVMVRCDGKPTRGVVVSRWIRHSVWGVFSPKFYVSLLTKKGVWSKMTNIFIQYDIENGYKLVASEAEPEPGE